MGKRGDEMRVGIDGQSTRGNKTGIGVYTAELIKSIKPDVVFYHPTKKNLSTAERLWYENVYLPPRINAANLDIMHFTGFAGTPRKLNCKKVVTVCDLIPLIMDVKLGTLSKWYWSKWLPYSVRSADKIIAISKNTQADIKRLLGKDSTVTYLATNYKPQKVEKPPYEFILTVGTQEPRKNLRRLISAFNKYESNLHLVIAGKAGWGEELRGDGRVHFRGYVSDNVLQKLYNQCKFFVYPSLYEGFGLPPLEAMACGKAVACSVASSLPEVCRKAVEYFDPTSEKDMMWAIKNLNTAPFYRKFLEKKALQQAKKFSWKKTAQETLEVYKEARCFQRA